MLAALLLISFVVQAQAAQPVDPPRARRVVSGSISTSDYPADALRAMAEGTATAQVGLDPEGRVTSCQVTQSAGHASLDRVTCELVSGRFRFERAAGASSRSIRITWRMPVAPQPPVPFAPSRVVVDTLTPTTGTAYCRRTIEGRPPDMMLERVCHHAATALEAPRNALVRVLYIVTMSADGERLPSPPGLRGETRLDYRLRFEVDPRGVVSHCEAVSPWEFDDDERELARRHCEGLLTGGRAIFLPSESDAVRRGEILATTRFEIRP